MIRFLFLLIFFNGFLSFDHRRIYYEVRGNGMPVVLIHGFITDGESWKRTKLLSALLKNGFKVVTLDLRGNGRSDKPRDEQAYALDAKAKGIMGLSRHLRLKRYNVVGYPRGSIIVARLLLRDKKIRRAVMGGMGS